MRCPSVMFIIPLLFFAAVATHCAGKGPLPYNDAGQIVPGGDLKVSGCFEQFGSGEAFTPPNAELFKGTQTKPVGWEFLWDGPPRGMHQLNQLRHDDTTQTQTIIADGSSIVIYRPINSYKLPATGIWRVKHTTKFDTTYSGTPQSQGCSDAQAGWVEVLMTNDVKSVERAIVWKNDGTKDGSFVLRNVCPASNADDPTSAKCYVGIKVGAHQDGKDQRPEFPCATGGFIMRANLKELCLE